MELSMKSRKELTRVTARRYRRASRKGKGVILNEFVAGTGYNRAYAAMLLGHYGLRKVAMDTRGAVRIVATKAVRKAKGRPRTYGKEVQVAVEKLWRRFGYVCGKRLVIVIRSCLPYLENHRDLHIDAATCEALKTISAATVDRLLAPARKRLFLKGIRYTKPVSALAQRIPIRTFGEWDDVTPGHLQADLVGHDGGIVGGPFCFTFSLTDVCTGWTERYALLNRASRWITAALDQMCTSIPFAVTELHPDNGSEFINRNLISYCQQHQIRMSRSRPGRKNDNCYVEQKNFDTVRKLVGYFRYDGTETVALMNQLYQLHGLLQNYVYPSQKLISKNRQGSTVHKQHDHPTTPADRLLARNEVDNRTRWRIHVTRQNFDPIAIAQKVNSIQRRLLALARTYPDHRTDLQEATG